MIFTRSMGMDALFVTSEESIQLLNIKVIIRKRPSLNFVEMIMAM